MTIDTLVPVEGCWVRRRDNSRVLGRVQNQRRSNGKWELQIDWGEEKNGWIQLEDLECGLCAGWAVQDVPLSARRKPLGPGRIVGRRRLGGREQMLVQLDKNGKSVWLPYENLRRIKDAHMRYLRAETGVEDHAERFRLRLLAHALENWNELTGALDRLDVDPLPHQIQLVHRILTSGNYNWLIADDVGLGKTIEVGLLLGALARKGQGRRVLIITPAGLVRQWQDELFYKFNQEYEIYGRDFSVHSTRQWKLHDHVIVSIDLAKRDEHLETFRAAGGWDIVVFDEGHKLTRYASGERVQRYKLAEALRHNADAFLLLSGTPHQGNTDRFIAILELVRPDLRRQIQTLKANPDIVSELILRNRKSEVTDAAGNFIFKGLHTHRVPITPSERTREFQRLLTVYLRRGYKAGEGAGAAGRAIGFVMTTYRKLASSSVAAIERALELRLERLVNSQQYEEPISITNLDIEELAEGGDDQDILSEDGRVAMAKEFFEYEKQMIEELLIETKKVRREDEKITIFLDKVVFDLIREGKKLLVFTEYRATQSYLKVSLEQRFPEVGEVVLIHGSMSLNEKLDAISLFNENARILISTEAGGEGINLHHGCHVMVNYDLPWNPARLVQRVGRLYRYGQNETVVVFNLHARDSFDNAAIDLMLTRVAQIVSDMAPIGEEFNERLQGEILGEVLDNVDFASILQAATDMNMERTKSEIEEAVERARRAQELQQEIFTHIRGYDPNALEGTLGFTMQHVGNFVRGMLEFIGADLQEELYEGQVIEIRLPENLRGSFAEFGQRTVVRVTTDRRRSQRLKDTVLLDFESPFFQFLIEEAKKQSFDGIYASAAVPSGPAGVLTAWKLRWQDDQGEPLLEEFLPFFIEESGGIDTKPRFLAEWLMQPLQSASLPNPHPQNRRADLDKLTERANEELAKSVSRFKHPNGLVLLAAADCKPLAQQS